MAKLNKIFRSGLFFVLFVMGIITYATVIVALWPITSLTQRRRIACSWAQYNRRILAIVCGLRENIMGME